MRPALETADANLRGCSGGKGMVEGGGISGQVR